METNQINVFTAAVFGHFQEIQHAKKTRGLRQLGSDVRKTDLFNRVDFNLACLIEPVTVTHFDMRPHPYSHA